MKEIFKDLDINIKKSLISMLIQISEADNQYHENEIHMIKNTGLKMELSVEDIKEIKHRPDHFPFSLPDSVQRRISLFYYLLYMIRIDGKIDIREKELLKQIGFRLYLNPELLQEFFNLFEKYSNRPIPDELLVQKVKRYLN